jgi:hypothetical protein
VTPEERQEQYIEIIRGMAKWVHDELKKKYPDIEINVRSYGYKNFPVLEIGLNISDTRTAFILLRQYGSNSIAVERYQMVNMSETMQPDEIAERHRVGVDDFNAPRRTGTVEAWHSEGTFEIADPKSFDKILNIAETQFRVANQEHKRIFLKACDR